MLPTLQEIVDRGGDVDDVLRAVVDVLAGSPQFQWAAVHFLEEGMPVLGPASGEPDEARRRVTPIRYQGRQVGELVVDGETDPALLARVAELISPHVLLGWDTGGTRWEP